jgi:glycosyltransferase involved in cell wall biosynthesis
VTRAIESVAHIVPSFFRARDGTVGGAERYVLELAKAMSTKVPTYLYSYGDRAETFTDGELRIRIVKRTLAVRSELHNPLSLRLFPKLARHSILHCHQPNTLGANLVALFARALRKPVFASELGGGGWNLSAYLSTERWFDAHLHISEYSRRIAGHVADDRHLVIYGGVDGTLFRPPSTNPARQSVLFVGRLMPHKGIDYLIDAVGAELPLTIVGRAYNEEYTRLLRQKAEGKRVTFKQDADDASLISEYQNALACVLPSVFRDCYGNHSLVPELLGQTLLEAMACGTPTICSDVASMPEVVLDGTTGFVTPPNDPSALHGRLLELRNNPGLVERFGLAARERAIRHFSWSAVVERCLEAYRSAGVSVTRAQVT